MSRPAEMRSVLGGRTALVTGGAIRVGRAISLALAGAGARVIVHYHTSGDAAAEVVAEIHACGGEAVAIPADLSTTRAAFDLADRAEAIGPVDVLVNSASVFPAEPLERVTPELWEATLAINLRAPFFLTQRLGGAMKARGWGVVVNIADLAGIQIWKGYAAHAISKAGLVHATKVAARALAPEVRVGAITPGAVLPPENMSDEEVDRLAARAPLGRIGSAEDVAHAVLYLLTSDFVTGEVLVVDGGRSLV